jgi:hypothetical protein
MPTGYPGMMILALVPPAWFYVMNGKIKKMKAMPIDNNEVKQSLPELILPS